MECSRCDDFNECAAFKMLSFLKSNTHFLHYHTDQLQTLRLKFYLSCHSVHGILHSFSKIIWFVFAKKMHVRACFRLLFIVTDYIDSCYIFTVRFRIPERVTVVAVVIATSSVCEFVQLCAFCFNLNNRITCNDFFWNCKHFRSISCEL